MFNDKKKNNAFNNLPKGIAATDKADWEVREKAEEFARRYSYAVMQDDWVKAEKVDEEMREYKNTLILSDRIIFDETINNL